MSPPAGSPESATRLHRAVPAEGVDAAAVLVGRDQLAAETPEGRRRNHDSTFHVRRALCDHGQAGQAVDRVQGRPGVALEGGGHEQPIAETAEAVERDPGGEGAGREVEETRRLTARPHADDARRRAGVEREHVARLERAPGHAPDPRAGREGDVRLAAPGRVAAGPVRERLCGADPGGGERARVLVESTNCPSARGPATSTMPGTFEEHTPLSHRRRRGARGSGNREHQEGTSDHREEAAVPHRVLTNIHRAAQTKPGSTGGRDALRRPEVAGGARRREDSGAGAMPAGGRPNHATSRPASTILLP